MHNLHVSSPFLASLCIHGLLTSSSILLGFCNSHLNLSQLPLLFCPLKKLRSNYYTIKDTDIKCSIP